MKYHACLQSINKDVDVNLFQGLVPTLKALSMQIHGEIPIDLGPVQVELDVADKPKKLDHSNSQLFFSIV